MKRVIMLGVGAVIVAGLLLSVSIGAYSQFVFGNGESFRARCTRGCDRTIPPAFQIHSPNLLIAGLLSGSFGIALLIIRRQEIEG